MRITAGAYAFIIASMLSAMAPVMADEPLPRAKPKDVGMSSQRLARIATTLNADVEHGRLPGAVIAVARKGKLVYFEAFGWRDKAAGVKMTTDTIFSIASMTKPMVTVGALMLVEEGGLSVGDPRLRGMRALSAI